MNTENGKSISEELENFMRKHQFSSLEELFAIANEDLLSFEGFGWRLMKEVLQLREIQ